MPFRTICEELGAALTFTEFLSAEALTRGAPKALDRMWPSLDGRRFAVQIFGREPDALARAAGMAVDVGASIVDINMGCPAKKVTAGAVRLGAHARARSSRRRWSRPCGGPCPPRSR